MPIQEVKKPGLRDIKSTQTEEGKKIPIKHDEALYERFLLWKDQAGHSHSHIARMINRSTAAVSTYINRIYQGDLAAIEKDIASLLRREEELEFVTIPEAFCNTLASRLIWEVLQFCDEHCDMGVAIGPSGIGKTTTCNEYKRLNRNTVFVTADIATRSLGTVLKMLAKRVGSTPHGAGSNSALLHAVIERLKNSKRLVIMDEAHFLTWEAFEVMRKVHDCAGVGVVYVGMERLYDQMTGRNGMRKNYLFEQIYSRIAIKRDELPVEWEDVKTLADSIRPGLAKDCIDFLHQRAQTEGRLRNVSKLLQVAGDMHREYTKPINVELLKMAEAFQLRGKRHS